VHALVVTGEHPASWLAEVPVDPDPPPLPPVDDVEPDAPAPELVPLPEPSLPELPLPVLPPLTLESEPLAGGLEVPLPEPPHATTQVAAVMASHVTFVSKKFI
jgi:hypothetical protein